MRLVYARYNDGRHGLYFLEDGTARELRTWARSTLLCPIPDCSMPQLTTVARARGRDGFRHGPGSGGHSEESLFHLQGKARIAHWLRATYPTSDVREEEATNPARARVADVMLTSRNGKRVAFEIQYAPLNPVAWAKRHQSYVDQDIVDVWLFGHVGSQRKPKFGDIDDEDVKLNPTHEAVVAAGLPLLWLNPLLGQIATATKDLWFQNRRFTVPADDRVGYTRIESLDAFRVTVDGLWSDDTRAFARNADEFDTLQRLTREKEAREEAEAKERARLRAEAKAKAQALWERSELHKTLLAEFAGVWPEFLDATVPLDASIPHAQWQAQLFSSRSALADDSGRLRVKACIEALPGVFQSERNAALAIDMWFQTLVAYRYLTRKPVFGGGSSDYQYVLSSPAEYEAKMRARYPTTARNNPAVLGVAPEGGEPISPKEPNWRKPEPTLVRTTTCPICRMPLHDSDAICIPY
jgi:hypothetical protein